VKYRFLGYPDCRFPDLKHNEIYNLRVKTTFWGDKPVILKPFYYPYNS